MLRKLIALLLIVVAVANCSGSKNLLKSADLIYSKNEKVAKEDVLQEWFDGIVAVGRGPLYSSGTVIFENEEFTFIATAQHVAEKPNNHVYLDGAKIEILETTNHELKDISILKIKRINVRPLKVNKRIFNSTEITIGHIDGDLSKKRFLVGKAVPGQSGGGVFQKGLGLVGIVSTTHTSVLLVEALEEMGFSWILSKSVLSEQIEVNQG